MYTCLYNLAFFASEQKNSVELQNLKVSYAFSRAKFQFNTSFKKLCYLQLF